MGRILERNLIKKYLRLSAYIGGLILFSFHFSNAQNLPKEIRGYKVQKVDISVKNAGEKPEAKDKKSDLQAFVTVSEPELVDVSLTGVTFEISATIDALEESGTIDFLTFNDFRVNGLKVEIEEYKESFNFKKGEKIILPKPIEIFVGATQTLIGAVKEASDSKEEWTVTGRIFVFGQFKKSFLKFKRVVPIEINLKIKNPLRNNPTKN